MGVVIPTLDGGARFRLCLEALAGQELRADALVVVDSGSGDGTPEAAREQGAQVLSIRPEQFRHGAARNLGAEALPDVDVIVFLVQDAVPVGRDWLGCLVAALEPAEVGAVTARQVPPQGAHPLTCATVERSPMGSAAARRVGPHAREQLQTFGPREWRGKLLLDSIACAVRGPLFRRLGFRDTDFGEDALLAYELLWGGWALAHEPRAVVEHGHAYDGDSVALRYEQDARFFREQFGLRVRPSWLSILKGYAAEVAADRSWLAEHPGFRTPEVLQASSSLRWSQVNAQYRGSRGALGQLPTVRDVPGPAEFAA